MDTQNDLHVAVSYTELKFDVADYIYPHNTCKHCRWSGLYLMMMMMMMMMMKSAYS